MSITELADLVRAGLDADERLAHETTRQVAACLNGADTGAVGKWRVVTRPTTGTFVVAVDQYERVVEVCPTYGGGYADHISRHDPHRVLAEVVAKRRLLDEVLDWDHYEADDPWYSCPSHPEYAKVTKATGPLRLRP